MSEVSRSDGPDTTVVDGVSLVGCPYCEQSIALRVTSRRIATDSGGRPVVSVDAALAVHRCSEPHEQPRSGEVAASAVDTALVRRRLQHEMTAAEWAHRSLPQLMTRDLPALCDEVDRLREIAVPNRSLPVASVLGRSPSS